MIKGRVRSITQNYYPDANGLVVIDIPQINDRIFDIQVFANDSIWYIGPSADYPKLSNWLEATQSTDPISLTEFRLSCHPDYSRTDKLYFKYFKGNDSPPYITVVYSFVFEEIEQKK